MPNGISKHGSSRRTALKMLLGRNIPLAEAKSGARKMVVQFKALEEQKRKHGSGSLDAYRFAKREADFANVAKMVREIDPEVKISKKQSVVILRFFHYTENMLHLHGLKIEFHEFLHEYAQFVWGKSGYPFHGSKKDAIASGLGMADFAKNYLRQRKLSEDEVRDFVQNMDVSSESLFPEIPRFEFAPKFFTRIRNESPNRERELHKIENEERGILLEFNQLISKPHSFYLAKLPLDSQIRGWVLDLSDPISEKEYQEAKEKIRGFDKKPTSVKERIIQEMRANRIGEELVALMTAEINELIKYTEQFYRSQWFQPLFAQIKSEEYTALQDYRKWVIQCLKRPGNQRFLVKKVIEYFSKK